MDNKRILSISLLVLGFMLLVVTPTAMAQEPDPDVGGFLCLSGAMCALPIVFLIIGILIAVWVYKDANSRGMNGVLWLIVVILLGLIGLIIYLIVRRGHPPMGAAPPPGMPPPGYGAPPPQYGPPPGGPPPGHYGGPPPPPQQPPPY